MSGKHELREQRYGTIINQISRRQEDRCGIALRSVITNIEGRHPLQLRHDSSWLVSHVSSDLKRRYPGIDFHSFFPSSSMRPDGGILSIVDKRGDGYPILISEVKNQGTNDLRESEGKIRQAKGNAIERLGKNVIGFRAAMLHEDIFPFVCFGDGCDFAPDSTILDRVVTIAMFGKLNKIYVHNEGPHGQFNRGSFFFRPELWHPEEMARIMVRIADISIEYYLNKYGAGHFMLRR